MQNKIGNPETSRHYGCWGRRSAKRWGGDWVWNTSVSRSISKLSGRRVSNICWTTEYFLVQNEFSYRIGLFRSTNERNKNFEKNWTRYNHPQIVRPRCWRGIGWYVTTRPRREGVQRWAIVQWPMSTASPFVLIFVHVLEIHPLPNSEQPILNSTAKGMQDLWFSQEASKLIDFPTVHICCLSIAISTQKLQFSKGTFFALFLKLRSAQRRGHELPPAGTTWHRHGKSCTIHRRG